jgi:hypothetical protein
MALSCSTPRAFFKARTLANVIAPGGGLRWRERLLHIIPLPFPPLAPASAPRRLKVGSGDVAQLDFFIRDFDAYLNKALRMTPERGRSAGEWAVIYSHIEALLKQMRQLYESAYRHIDPIVQAAIERER